MTDIQKLMLSMFIHLRLGVGIIGLSLPLVLVIGGWFNGVHFAGSMSAYYHATAQCSLPKCSNHGKDAECTDRVAKDCAWKESGKGPMRNWFVGNLFFIGAAMFLVKGFSVWENWALNIAGVAAPCVALFPMDWPCRTDGFSIHSLHYPSAITFFVCAGFTCIFCSEKTLREAERQGKSRRIIKIFRTWYIASGIAMIALPVLAWIYAYDNDHLGYWLEMAGVCAFGAFWIVKTIELRWSQVEHKALTGQLREMNPKRLM